MKHVAGRNFAFSRVLALVAVVVIAGVGFSQLTYAATGSLTFSPNSGSYTVGNNLVLTLHENSGSDPAIGVDAYINFPAGQLQFLSASTTAPFSVAPPDTTGTGSVEIVRGAYSGVTGDQVVSVVTFKILAAGTATVSFGSGSTISPAAGGASLLTSKPSGTYTLSAPSTPTPPTTPPSSGGGTTPPATTAPSGSSKSKSVTVKTSGTGVTVPNNGSVAVSTPVDVEPATVQTEGVTKVEYYLNGKLVSTETKAPYTYRVDTTKLDNGSYSLVSKTYYVNGSTKSATQHIIVKNTANKTTSNGVGISLVVLAAIIGGFILIQRRRSTLKTSPYAPVEAHRVVTSDPSNNPVPPAAPTSVAPTPVPAPHSAPTDPGAPQPGTVISHDPDESPKQ